VEDAGIGAPTPIARHLTLTNHATEIDFYEKLASIDFNGFFFHVM
jgi:hypothetical protein